MKRKPVPIPKPSGPGRGRQAARFSGSFTRIERALERDDPAATLREDPSGVAPERALVFVTAGRIQRFAKAAGAVGLEMLVEVDEEELLEVPEGFTPPGAKSSIAPTLYATMPTLDAFNALLTLWKAYQRGAAFASGTTPWRDMFELLLELRPWGPQDRFPEGARAVIADALPADDDAEVALELEIWPSASLARKTRWRGDTEKKIAELGGRIVDRSSIAGAGFGYEALLAKLRAGAVRALIDDPEAAGSLAQLEGVQFILPQTIAQSAPIEESTEIGAVGGAVLAFDADAPTRVALLDGTPLAAHPALDGGVVIEDVYDLVRLSRVSQRAHGTAMASLIMRGDLDGDGAPAPDTRLVSVPVLVDGDGRARSPEERLFVDVLHTAVARLLEGEGALAPTVFVVNVSIGVDAIRFGGRISALARLLDWWAARAGVLFVVSAGNIGEPLVLDGVSSVEFEDADPQERRRAVDRALQGARFERTLLAPAEALNVVTVGALSADVQQGPTPPPIANVFQLEPSDMGVPAISSACGGGPFRSIKPDVVHTGGVHRVRASPAGAHKRLSVAIMDQHTGLMVAAPGAGASPFGTRRDRGTSCAAALATRAVLQSAAALIGEDGPFEGQELPREDLALLTRALAVGSGEWNGAAHAIWEEAKGRLGPKRHQAAKFEVARYFGYGGIDPERMAASPACGVTLVGLGSIKADEAWVFQAPLPASLSGEKIGRSLAVTLAWFSPVDGARAQYRLAELEAVCAGVDEDGDNEEKDGAWVLRVKTDGPDANMVKRGTVWSRRLVHAVKTTPDYGEEASIPIRVQCRDASGGGLDPDLAVRFALAVTLEVEATARFDVLEEVREQLAIRARGRG